MGSSHCLPVPSTTPENQVYKTPCWQEGTGRGSPAVEDSWALVDTGRERSVLVAVNSITSSSVTVSEVANGWTPLGEKMFHQQVGTLAYSQLGRKRKT